MGKTTLALAYKRHAAGGDSAVQRRREVPCYNVTQLSSVAEKCLATASRSCHGAQCTNTASALLCQYTVETAAAPQRVTSSVGPAAAPQRVSVERHAVASAPLVAVTPVRPISRAPRTAQTVPAAPNIPAASPSARVRHRRVKDVSEGSHRFIYLKRRHQPLHLFEATTQTASFT